MLFALLAVKTLNIFEKSESSPEKTSSVVFISYNIKICTKCDNYGISRNCVILKLIFQVSMDADTFCSQPMTDTEQTKCSNREVPNNTKRRNQWTVKIFNTWAMEHNNRSSLFPVENEN